MKAFMVKMGQASEVVRVVVKPCVTPSNVYETSGPETGVYAALSQMSSTASQLTPPFVAASVLVKLRAKFPLSEVWTGTEAAFNRQALLFEASIIVA